MMSTSLSKIFSVGLLSGGALFMVLLPSASAQVKIEKSVTESRMAFSGLGFAAEFSLHPVFGFAEHICSPLVTVGGEGEFTSG